LYHSGNADQVKNRGQKQEKSKPAALKPKAAAPHQRLHRPPDSDGHESSTSITCETRIDVCEIQYTGPDNAGMTYEPIRTVKPEEAELKKKQVELSELKSKLADRELFLTNLRAELLVFERKYVKVVGQRYAELDEIEAKIAEHAARAHPKDRHAQDFAAQARSQADNSRTNVESSLALGGADSVPPRSQTLRNLYREVAKRIHPDLATDNEDRLRRQKLMAEANRAFEEGDEARLRRILDEYESSPEAVKGEGAAADLIRVIRKIAQANRRLVEIEKEVTHLEKSELFELRGRVDEAAAEGRDLLREMAEGSDAQIAVSRERLKTIYGR
jgi:DnaJ-domain-containing protein 1